MINTLTQIFNYFLLIWFACLAALVMRDVLLKHDSLRGILSTNEHGKPDPERVVLVLFSIGFALYYSLNTLAVPIEKLPKIDGRPAMPDVSYEVLAVLFGTQSTFIFGKILRLYMGARGHD